MKLGRRWWLWCFFSLIRDGHVSLDSLGRWKIATNSGGQSKEISSVGDGLSEVVLSDWESCVCSHDKKQARLSQCYRLRCCNIGQDSTYRLCLGLIDFGLIGCWLLVVARWCSAQWRRARRCAILCFIWREEKRRLEGRRASYWQDLESCLRIPSTSTKQFPESSNQWQQWDTRVTDMATRIYLWYPSRTISNRPLPM